MSQPAVYKTVTLTATASVQNLLTALQAADASIGGAVGSAYREVNLQADPGNAGTNNVLIGDDQLSASRLGYVLTPGASRTYRLGIMEGVPIANMHFLAAAGSPKLNVELMM